MIRKIGRISRLGCGLAAGLFCVLPAWAQTEVRVGMLSSEIATFCVNTGGLHQAAFSPYPPEASGLAFHKIHINVSQAPVTVSGGDLDMAECEGPSGLVQAWTKGARNAVVVFVGSVKPNYVLVGGKSIKSLKDLKGKAIGSPGPQSTATEASTMILKRGAGLVLDRDYKLVSAGTGGARAAALAAGKIDAIPTYPPVSYKMISDGFHLLGDEADYVPLYVSGAMVVNKTWAAKNGDALVALLKTFIQTGTWLRDPARKQEVIASIAKHIFEGPKPMGMEHARQYYKDVIEMQRVAFNGYAPPEAYMSNLEIMTERGMLAKKDYPPLRDIVDYSYLNRALKELGMPPVPEIK
jgi:ABC-type nitrate/sulfonate/bicarbonate transport system substrate-binding protein